MRYIEKPGKADPLRKEYLESLEDLLLLRQQKATKARRVHFLEMKENQEAYRNELISMLGWPLTEYGDTLPKAETTLLSAEEDRNLYRVQFTLPIGIKFYGLYFEHPGKKNLPFVIAQHGGAGTPEVCGGVLPDGSRQYFDMAMRVFRRGVNVFAPQLLLWNQERFTPAYDRVAMDAKLKQVGSSITAVEIYGIRKCIDYFSCLPETDPARIGMVGLSYGGFYTIYTTALDTRIRAAFSSSFYNDRYSYAWPDWVWNQSGLRFLDNEVASLVYPRYLGLAMGEWDDLFDIEISRVEFETLRTMYTDKDWVEFYAFREGHAFPKEDEPLERFFDELIKAEA